jgi:hypothetical protein
LFLQARQVVGQALPIVSKFRLLLARIERTTASGSTRSSLVKHLAQPIRLVVFAFRQAIGLASHRIESARGLLLLHAAQQIRGFPEPVGSAAGLGLTLLSGGRATHIVACLPQPVERLLSTRVR